MQSYHKNNISHVFTHKKFILTPMQNLRLAPANEFTVGKKWKIRKTLHIHKPPHNVRFLRFHACEKNLEPSTYTRFMQNFRDLHKFFFDFLYLSRFFLSVFRPPNRSSGAKRVFPTVRRRLYSVWKIQQKRSIKTRYLKGDNV